MTSFNHARSNSLPSRSHPAAVIVENHLCRLKSADTSCSSTSSICRNLPGLKDLHESLHDLIQLPSVQQELSQKCSDEILNGSVKLLDVCSTAKEIMLRMKESVRELESALRRNRGGESNLAHDIDAYVTSKKKVNKMITKCIKSLKISEKKCSKVTVNEEDNLLSTVTMLEESEVISFSILKSVLLHLSGSNKDSSTQKGWSLVNKFVQSKRVHSDIEQEQEGDVHGMIKIDDALSALIKNKSCKESKAVAIQNVLKQLRTLEMTIQELEEILETIFRSLIKRRASLLNILSIISFSCSYL